MAGVSVSSPSGQGETDPDKSSNVTEGKAAVDKLLNEANAAADNAKSALEHLDDPPKGPGMKEVCAWLLPRVNQVAGLVGCRTAN